MTKRLMFSGAVAAFVVTALVMVNAQGFQGRGARRGPAAQAEARFGPGPGPMHGPMMMNGRGGRLGPFARLDLTDAQRDQLRDVLTTEREGDRDLVAALGDARRALHAAIFAATPDAGAVSAAQSKVAAAEAAVLADQVKSQQAIAAILTPEQKAKLAESGGRGGRGPGRGPGRGAGRR